MVSISYSGAEIYSIVIVGKYCQSYTDPGLNGAEWFPIFFNRYSTSINSTLTRVCNRCSSSVDISFWI